MKVFYSSCSNIKPAGSSPFFLDIETTGLSKERSILYMIGLGYYDRADGVYRVIQWFNDDGTSEPEMLEALSDLLEACRSGYRPAAGDFKNIDSVTDHHAAAGSLADLHAADSPLAALHAADSPLAALHAADDPLAALHAADSPLAALHAADDPLAALHAADDPVILITFNGEGFDLPWLEAHYAMNDLPSPFQDCISCDLYKKLRPFEKVFGLRGGRQKDWEVFLGIRREDRYDGGTLIRVYRDYLKNRLAGSDELIKLLLLHNREDMEGMAYLAGMLPLTGLWEGMFEPVIMQTPASSDVLNFLLKLREEISEQISDILFHKPLGTDMLIRRNMDDIFESKSTIRLNMTDQGLILQVPLYRGTLKYFFPDYRNYYYLPEEDRAIHKSVGQFVDRDFRVRATPSTCYQKEEGMFLPLPLKKRKGGFRSDGRMDYEEAFAVFKREYKDKRAYVRVNDLIEEDSDRRILKVYLTGLLHELAIGIHSDRETINR